MKEKRWKKVEIRAITYMLDGNKCGPDKAITSIIVRAYFKYIPAEIRYAVWIPLSRIVCVLDYGLLNFIN